MWVSDIIDRHSNRLLKILSIVAFLNLIVIGLTIIIIGPAEGYEISIYDAYPQGFWLIICATFLIGFVSLLLGIVSKVNSGLLFLPSFALLLVNIIIILLPLFRNYYISDFSDEIFHLGMAKDILSGGVGSSDYYPLSHILIAIISSLCDLELHTVTQIVPSVYFVIYILGFYLLSNSLNLSFQRKMWVIMFSFVPLYTYYDYIFFPQHFALCLVPIIIAIYYNTYNSFRAHLSCLLVLTLLLFSLPLLHPLGSLFTLVILATFEVSRCIHHYLHPRRECLNNWNIGSKCGLLNPQTVAQIILGVTFVSWFSYFSIFRHSIEKAFDAFFLGVSGDVALLEVSEKLNKANYSQFDALDLAFKSNGQEIIFSLLSLTSIIYIIYIFICRREKISLEFIYFPLLYVFFSLYFISTLFISFMSTGYQIRIYCWALIFTVVLCGLAIGDLHSRIQSTKIRSYIICFAIIILVISASVGVHNTYLSPIVKKPNLQVSEAAWDGMTWYYYHKCSDPTIYIDQLPGRAPYYLFGHSLTKPANIGSLILAPSCLGYDSYRTLFTAVNETNSYLVITDRNYAVYTTLWPNIGLIRSVDFVNLRSDPTAQLVYINGGLSLWKVQEYV